MSTISLALMMSLKASKVLMVLLFHLKDNERTSHWRIKTRKLCFAAKLKSSILHFAESGRPFSVELQVSSPFQVRIQMQEETENEQVVVEDDVIIRRVIVTPTSGWHGSSSSSWKSSSLFWRKRLIHFGKYCLSKHKEEFCHHYNFEVVKKCIWPNATMVEERKSTKTHTKKDSSYTIWVKAFKEAGVWSFAYFQD